MKEDIFNLWGVNKKLDVKLGVERDIYTIKTAIACKVGGNNSRVHSICSYFHTFFLKPPCQLFRMQYICKFWLPISWECAIAENHIMHESAKKTHTHYKWRFIEYYNEMHPSWKERKVYLFSSLILSNLIPSLYVILWISDERIAILPSFPLSFTVFFMVSNNKFVKRKLPK